MQERPYFLTNPKWYRRMPEDSERGFELTEEAPEEAVKSYNEFYAIVTEEKDGKTYIIDF